jgi:hypothetical protein
VFIRSILGSLWLWKGTPSDSDSLLAVDLLIDRVMREHPNDPQAQQAALRAGMKHLT